MAPPAAALRLLAPGSRAADSRRSQFTRRIMVYLTVAAVLWLVFGLPAIYHHFIHQPAQSSQHIQHLQQKGALDTGSDHPADRRQKSAAQLANRLAAEFWALRSGGSGGGGGGSGTARLMTVASNGTASSVPHPALTRFVHPWEMYNASEYGNEHVKRSTFRTAIDERSGGWDIKFRLQLVDEYIDGPEFKAKLDAIRSYPKRGVLINAGGPKFLANAAVALRTLRVALNCTLPVELVWHDDGEMDVATFAAMKKEFAPLDGFNILSRPFPRHHRLSNDSFTGYAKKVYSLLHVRFQEVLMMDADAVLLQHPDAFFEHPQFKLTGNLFWPDAWTRWTGASAFDDLGLSRAAVTQALGRGRGWSRRDSESGLLAVDRLRHLGSLEYTFWVNCFSEQLAVWGDKDTFKLGWAAAGAAHLFSQVMVPPSGVFVWRPDMLLVKATGQKTAGWQLLGFLQHDSWGAPAFLHRTINKWALDSSPWPLELISAPMPVRWADYYIAHDSQGPTKGVPWDYVAPYSAFFYLGINPAVTHARTAGRSWWQDGAPAAAVARSSSGSSPSSSSGGGGGGAGSSCPAAHFLDYWTMLEEALPIDRDRSLEAACAGLLRSALGPDLYRAYRDHGYLDQPQLLWLRGDYTESMAWSPLLNKSVALRRPSGTPIAAWVPDSRELSPQPGQFSWVVQQAYDAHGWLIRNVDLFPMLARYRRQRLAAQVAEAAEAAARKKKQQAEEEEEEAEAAAAEGSKKERKEKKKAKDDAGGKAVADDAAEGVSSSSSPAAAESDQKVAAKKQAGAAASGGSSGRSSGGGSGSPPSPPAQKDGGGEELGTRQREAGTSGADAGAQRVGARASDGSKGDTGSTADGDGGGGGGRGLKSAPAAAVGGGGNGGATKQRAADAANAAVAQKAGAHEEDEYEDEDDDEDPYLDDEDEEDEDGGETTTPHHRQQQLRQVGSGGGRPFRGGAPVRSVVEQVQRRAASAAQHGDPAAAAAAAPQAIRHSRSGAAQAAMSAHGIRDSCDSQSPGPDCTLGGGAEQSTLLGWVKRLAARRVEKHQQQHEQLQQRGPGMEEEEDADEQGEYRAAGGRGAPPPPPLRQALRQAARSLALLFRSLAAETGRLLDGAAAAAGGTAAAPTSAAWARSAGLAAAAPRGGSDGGDGGSSGT